jgi:hypothetical protein
LLIALPRLHHKQPAVAVIAQLDHAPGVQPHEAAGEDTILLQAQRLRGGDTANSTAASYTLHPRNTTRIQILVPHAPPGTLYSIDLKSTTLPQPSIPIHLDGLAARTVNSLNYVEFSLQPGLLEKGSYEGVLHSGNGSYNLHFSIAPEK